MHEIDENGAYALQYAEEKQRRFQMLDSPHIRPLTQYLQSIQVEMGPDYAMPYFDPCDGGINAQILFLLEAPGPRAVGSGFISQNNPDQTAKNMNELLNAAGISRQIVLLWNIVPWYVGEQGRIRPVTKQDIKQALPYLHGLLHLLSSLKALVLVGRKAQLLTPEIQRLVEVPLYQCYHPSPRVFNVWPEKRSAVLDIFKQVANEVGI